MGNCSCEGTLLGKWSLLLWQITATADPIPKRFTPMEDPLILAKLLMGRWFYSVLIKNSFLGYIMSPTGEGTRKTWPNKYLLLLCLGHSCVFVWTLDGSNGGQ